MARRVTTDPRDRETLLRELARLQRENERLQQTNAELGGALVAEQAETTRFKAAMMRERTRAEAAEARAVPAAFTVTDDLSQRLLRKKYGSRFDMPGSDAAGAELARLRRKHGGGSR